MKGNGGMIFSKMKFNLQNCNNDDVVLKNVVVFIACSQIRRCFLLKRRRFYEGLFTTLSSHQIRLQFWPKALSFMSSCLQ